MLNNDNCIDILTDEFNSLQVYMLGASETYIAEVGNIKLDDIELIHSDRKHEVQRQGEGLMKAAKSCLGWEGINNRKLVVHFTYSYRNK